MIHEINGRQIYHAATAAALLRLHTGVVELTITPSKPRRGRPRYHLASLVEKGFRPMLGNWAQPEPAPTCMPPAPPTPLDRLTTASVRLAPQAQSARVEAHFCVRELRRAPGIGLEVSQRHHRRADHYASQAEPRRPRVPLARYRMRRGPGTEARVAVAAALGVTARGDPPCICELRPNSVAARCGELAVGDELVSVK